MSRGRQNAKAVEYDFPHHADVVVPEGGFGMTLNAMYDFHAQRGIEPKRGHGRHDANGSVIRWCFSELAVAEAGGGIMVQTGGSLVGAIGVSGSPGGDADDACAKVGISAIQNKIDF